MTFEDLKKICPTIRDKASVYVPYLNDYMENYGIVSVKQKAAFIAQIAHESGSFNYTTEIASGDAYENRKDLGNIYKGDGRKYKGRGLIQITGRNNYRRVSNELGEDFVTYPDLLATPRYAVMSACWFWTTIKGNELAELPDTWRSKTKGYSPFQYITFRINGGQNGAIDRLKYYKMALSVIK